MSGRPEPLEYLHYSTGESRLHISEQNIYSVLFLWKSVWQ